MKRVYPVREDWSAKENKRLRFLFLGAYALLLILGFLDGDTNTNVLFVFWFLSSVFVFFFYEKRINVWTAFALGLSGPLGIVILVTHVAIKFLAFASTAAYRTDVKEIASVAGQIAGAFVEGAKAAKERTGDQTAIDERRELRLKGLSEERQEAAKAALPTWARIENGVVTNIENGVVTYIQICPKCGKESTSGKQFWKLSTKRDKFGPINGICSYCQHWYSFSIKGPDA